MARLPRVAYVSLGCRTNRVETDQIAAALERAGAVCVDEDEADLVVINTCAVTGEAEAKTRKAIRHAASLRQVRLVVATGCVASLHADSLVTLSEKVAVVADKTKVASEALRLLGDSVANVTGSSLIDGCQAIATVDRSRSTTPTGRTRPGVKVQDGCDHRCSYCIVWRARGPARSVPSEEVVSAVATEVAAGAQEVVLTGINVGSYHDELVGDLGGLLRTLLRVTEVGRLRIASIEPEDVTEALMVAMSDGGARVAPFLHVCLQSGCDATLSRMGRPYDRAFFAGVIDMARAHVPDISLGTDVIVGFPGETDADAAESLAFCRDMRFSRMHVFRYSRRPGTPAAQMRGQVAAPLVAERAARMRALSCQLREGYAASRVGREEHVLVQGIGQGVTGGLLEARLDPALPVGGIVHARVRAAHGGVLDCELIGDVESTTLPA